MMFKTIRDIPDITGKKVLLRLDLNVPIQDGKVTDGFRITQSLDTLNYLRDKGGKIIIIAHLESKEQTSLQSVSHYLTQFVPTLFVADPFSEEGKEKLNLLKNGDVAVLENIRHWDGEKNNDATFAKQLASLGDLFVNEAFSVSHRAHASIVGIPNFLPSYAGLLFEKEVTHLSKAFDPAHPYLFILGGAKFETKAPLIKKFITLADSVFIGGALANDLLKAKGYEIGESIHSDLDYGFKIIVNNKKVIVPVDVVVESPKGRITKAADKVEAGEKIWDAGPETVTLLAEKIKEAHFILWNGPLGLYEQGYKEGTLGLAKAISESKAESIVGGGDTLAAIKVLNVDSKISFISTAGGAMLDFLANETLPGLEALKKSV